MNEWADWQGEMLDAVPPPEAEPADRGNVTWYLPSWADVFREVGAWSVFWAVPATFVVARLANLLPPLLVPLAIVTSLAATATVVCVTTYTATRMLRWRRDPFCIHCGYSLTGRADGTPCPECGGATSEALCREYQRNPQAFIDPWYGRECYEYWCAPIENRDVRGGKR